MRQLRADEADGPATTEASAAAGATPLPLRGGLVWVLAVACAVAVANLYYGQPLLVLMADEFGVPESRLGMVSALTQAGYALGLLFFVPLGDTVDRKRLILTMLATVTVALLAVAASPNFVWLAAASLALGVTTIAPQLIVPLAAGLAAPAERGRVVGHVMSGLLIGILLSRTVSGVVGAQLGWRAVYGLAAGLNLALAGALAVLLPRGRPTARLSYPRLLWSLGGLFRDEPVLREACLFGAAGFGAFSAFWTTLAFFLADPPYGLGSDAVGLFGLVGVAGALAAPLAGRFADLRSPRLTIGVALAVVLASFGVLALFRASLGGLVAGVILLDVGAQANHISNQTRIYGLRPEVHNRLNTLYMVLSFVGGAVGSSLGTYGWAYVGWTGVCAAGAGLALVGLAGYGWTRHRRAAAPDRETASRK